MLASLLAEKVGYGFLNINGHMAICWLPLDKVYCLLEAIVVGEESLDMVLRLLTICWFY